MSAIHIRDIDPETLAALKRLAKSHRRSLQGELLAILDQAARMAQPAEDEPPLDLITVSTGERSAWRREEIYGDQAR